MKKLLLLLLLPFLSLAQIENKLDSLQKVAASNVAVKEQSKALQKIIEIYLDKDLAKATQETKRLSLLSKNGGCSDCEAMAVYLFGQIESRKGNFDGAYKFFEQSADKALKSKDYIQYQTAFLWKVQTMLNLNKFDEALVELDKYVKSVAHIKVANAKDKPTLEDIYFLYGIIYFDKGFLKTAIENYQKADQIIMSQNIEKPKRRIGINNNIAQVYRQLKNFDKAREYAGTAIELSRKTKDSMLIMNIMLHFGIIETDAKNYQKALPNLDRAYIYFNRINFASYKGSSALYLGIAYYHLKQYKNSIYFLEAARKTYKENGDNYSLAETMGYLSLNFTALKNFKAAKKFIDSSKLLMKDETDSPAYIEIINAEVQYYEQIGDFKNSLKTAKLRDDLKAKLDQKMNEESLNEVEAKYQNTKKAKTIKVLSSENQLAARKNSLQLFLFLGILFFLIMVAGVLYYAYRNKIRTAEKLKDINEMKSRFFANISHEFRTPLTLIKSPIQNLQSTPTDENQKQQLALIDKNANRMLELVDQLLELSKIDSGHLKLILKPGKLDNFLNSIAEPFVFQAKDNGISFILNIEKTPDSNYFDKDVIEKIATNLLSNAFKYNANKEPVYFSGTIENDELQLRISNSGSDLNQEDIPRLFERFYQKNDQQKGSGIGLALVKELVELYHGSVEATLENHQLRFLIKLPLNKDIPNAVKVNFVEEDARQAETPTSIADGMELPILLIVEDNVGIRTVIKDLFANDYLILEAENGESALKIAKKEIPDCIISDIMMPKMDGLAFTHAIKNNELTSFIPLVLLTAKTSEDTHLKALQSTADAFLTKPFNHEILKATIKQLIAERKKLQERYSKELVLRPVGIVINSVDEKFIAKLQDILDKELANANFSAEDFATAIGMSRMQLHRKLKTLLGVSTTEFLRNERLKVATDLLKSRNATISEIAYSVGFNDVSYFTKCFKELYQITPSQYQEAHI